MSEIWEACSSAGYDWLLAIVLFLVSFLTTSIISLLIDKRGARLSKPRSHFPE